MLTEELAEIVLLFCCFCFELRLLDGPRGLVCHLMLMVFPASQISAAKRDYTVLSQKPCQTLLKQKKKARDTMRRVFTNEYSLLPTGTIEYSLLPTLELRAILGL